MQTDMPFDLRDRLIALRADKCVAIIPLSERAKSAAEWPAGTVAAIDDHAVHADYWKRHQLATKRCICSKGVSSLLWQERARPRCG